MARKKRGDAIHGWVILDKPKGMNSTPVTNRVRWLFNAQKAGHGGTLDPMATGVLPVALGEASKTVPCVMDSTKEYRFTVTWGYLTDSDDSEGKIIATSKIRPGAEQILAVLEQFRGQILQVPPPVSALKINGARAYDLVRSGEIPEMKARKTNIYELELLNAHKEQADLRVCCGKGTYVRALARDIAAACKTLGHVSALHRQFVGPFSTKDTISLDALEKIEDREGRFEHLLSLESALDDIPALDISLNEAKTIYSGQSLSFISRSQAERLDHLSWDEPLWLRLDDKAVALAVVTQGCVRSTRVFNHWIN